MSRELILGMSVSIDGFVAGPNGENDWMIPSMSEAGRQWVAEQLGRVGLIAMGRRAYESMADFWPTASGPVAVPMNEIPKAVFSRSGAVSSPSMEKTLAALENEPKVEAAREGWLNPIVGGEDLVADIQRLKAEDGGPINALGGASFASSLIATGLVDEYRLVVHPVALGRGLPLFGGLESSLRLKLEEVERFDSGVVAKTYRPLQTPK